MHPSFHTHLEGTTQVPDSCGCVLDAWQTTSPRAPQPVVYEFTAPFAAVTVKKQGGDESSAVGVAAYPEEAHVLPAEDGQSG
jgi:hypothetical protein